MYEYDVIFIGSGHSCNHAATALDLRRMIFAFPTQTYMLVSGLIPLLKPF